MFCRPARKNSMNVPDEVQTARKRRAHIATDGPAIHCHSESPRTSLSANHPGGVCDSTTPRPSRAMWTRPRESLNHTGPSIPIHDSSVLMTPELWNRKRNVMLIATELVIDGK